MKPSPPYVEESDLERKPVAWPEPISGPDDPRLLSIPDVIERLRNRAVEADDPLDPISVSRRVLKELLRGYDSADAAARKGQGIEGGSSSAESAASLPAEADCSAAQSRDERALGEAIDQRDAAEEAFSQVYRLITGRSPEWSNAFGFAEALREIDDWQHAKQRFSAEDAP